MADLKPNATPLKQETGGNWVEWKNTFGTKPPRPESKFTGFVGQPTAARAAPRSRKVGPLTAVSGELTELFNCRPSTMWNYFVTEIGWGTVSAAMQLLRKA
jgi:hypothetical protein